MGILLTTPDKQTNTGSTAIGINSGNPTDKNTNSNATEDAAFEFSDDQQAAFTAISQFIIHPTKKVHVLEGFAGTGKTTLITKVLAHLPKIDKMLSALDPEHEKLDVVLTATTNKAAENFSDITGKNVSTIHSLLGLRVVNDFSNNSSSLVATDGFTPISDTLIVVDECGFISKDVFEHLFTRTFNCKFLLIGDPYQLINHDEDSAIVFKQGYETSILKSVVRQHDDNPIIQLATAFRQAVEDGQWFNFEPDGESIIHTDRDDFEKRMMAEFSRPDWRSSDSKCLAWTNRRVIDYNKAISAALSGNPNLEEDDYAVCNTYFKSNKCQIRTDQTVQITSVEEMKMFGVWGRYFGINNVTNAFMPDNREDRQRLLAEAQATQNVQRIKHIRTGWIDLRAAYACTVNKSQGSTYDRVFIDCDDIGRCRNFNQLARMMYVACSRPRSQIILTGDFD